MPVEPVTTTIDLLKSAVELLKSAVGVAQKIKNAELNDVFWFEHSARVDAMKRLKREVEALRKMRYATLARRCRETS